LDAEAADRQAYLIGDAETITWADLYRPIAHALGYNLASICVSMQNSHISPSERLRHSVLLRACFARLPNAVRTGLRASYLEWRGSPEGLRQTRTEAVTEERAALHTCRTRLPCEKARRQLGYVPIVDFEEACRRTLAWMVFAGYPIVGSYVKGGSATSKDLKGEDLG
jgi:nucleoside-diphosphate-sugar epimerase